MAWSSWHIKLAITLSNFCSLKTKSPILGLTPNKMRRKDAVTSAHFVASKYCWKLLPSLWPNSSLLQFHLLFAWLICGSIIFYWKCFRIALRDFDLIFSPVLTSRFIVKRGILWSLPGWGSELVQSASNIQNLASDALQLTCMYISWCKSDNPGSYELKGILNSSMNIFWSCLGLGKSFITALTSTQIQSLNSMVIFRPGSWEGWTLKVMDIWGF